jgi:ABC-type antimicrobial peptide transport system permease subunit
MLVAALVMAAATGIVFGFAPARRAAYLDPVIALKAE